MKLIYLFLLMIFINCDNEQDWKITLFGDGNDRPKSIIHLKKENQFIALGQVFMKVETDTFNNALVKISSEGQVLKKRYLGLHNNKFFNLYHNDSSLFVVGINDYKLAISKIDKELNIVKETVFKANEITDSPSPKLIINNENIFVILNNTSGEVEIIKMDKNLNILLTMKPQKTNLISRISFNDAILTSTNKICITGTAYSDKADEHDRYNYDVFFTQLDIKTGKTEWFTSYGNNEGYYAVNSMVEKDDKIYVTGMGRNNDGGVDDYFDINLYALNKSGKIEFVKQFSDPYSSEYGYDLKIFEKNLLIVGFCNDGKKYLTLKVDLNGELVNKRKFGDGIENSLEAVLKINDNQLILIGSTTNQRGTNKWEIIKTDISKL